MFCCVSAHMIIAFFYVVHKHTTIKPVEFILNQNFIFSDPSIEVTKIQEVALNNFIPHPVCVTGIVLSSLKMESGKISEPRHAISNNVAF